MWQYGYGMGGWGLGLMTVGNLLVWALIIVRPDRPAPPPQPRRVGGAASDRRGAVGRAVRPR